MRLMLFGSQYLEPSDPKTRGANYAGIGGRELWEFFAVVVSVILALGVVFGRLGALGERGLCRHIKLVGGK